MASFSSIGVGLGGSVDVQGLIDSSVEIARLPITRSTGLQYQAQMTQAKISTFGQIKSLVSALSDAASKLTSVTGWNAVMATSSNTAAVTASAVGGTVATSFSLEVQGLAKAQTTTSAAMLPVGGPVGEGVLRLEMGRWSDASTFTPGLGTPLEIEVGASDTLATIAGKINGAKGGVTATIVSDASGERLLLRSKATGEESGFRLSVTDSDGDDADDTGLSRLVAGATTTLAANARATVNGIAVTSATNTFTNTVAGVTFNALQETTAPVEITVASDSTAVKKNIDDFVKAYNAVNQALNDITSYDAQNKVAGLLQGDSSTLALQNTLRKALQSVATGTGAGGLKTLSDVGIVSAPGSDPLRPTGDLAVDSAKLDKALADPDAVKAFFRGADGGSVSDGVGGKIKAVTDSLLASDGFFASKDKLLDTALKRNAKDIERVEDRAASVRSSLSARYTALDTQMSQLNALNAYIAQQVTTWNNAKK
ncbi:flagellar filament capping protein FliD [Diaphorobacter sp. LR2014-1]|uniref:flagellar filament capping protein FliD n=1 Tax=Diaphorobacter sp. LR2014-1 TaxID=1933219 RepID=UPI000CDA38FF|nr:flagellar filament capping protein FliD [Diaphorobacter sp. LR2014-1]POR08133.1 flagellar cap protein FliD [Diaphorobacter sp. LR2014-1]